MPRLQDTRVCGPLIASFICCDICTLLAIAPILRELLAGNLWFGGEDTLWFVSHTYMLCSTKRGLPQSWQCRYAVPDRDFFRTSRTATARPAQRERSYGRSGSAGGRQESSRGAAPAGGAAAVVAHSRQHRRHELCRHEYECR